MLFKILHGDESRISTDVTPFHEGWAYVTHSGNYYVDMNIGTVEVPNNQRIKLNAKDAETLGGTSLGSILNSISDTIDKVTTITLPVSGWIEATNVYSQVVTVAGATINSKIDLYPTPEQLVELQSDGIALVAVNEDGIVTVYALNNKPTSDYSMQVTLTEVNGGV